MEPHLLYIREHCTVCGVHHHIDHYRVNHPNGLYIRGRCKRCMNLLKRKRQESDPLRFIRRCFSQLKSSRRKLQGIDKYKWTIRVEDVLAIYKNQKGLCAVTGIKMTWTRVNESTGLAGNHSIISIDRLDNTLGYIKSNIQLVCKRVNLMKGSLEQDVFLDWCRAIADADN